MDSMVKEEVFEWISKPENEDLLEIIRSIKKAAESDDWYDELSTSEKKSLEKGKRNHQEGNTLTSQKFWETHG